MLRPVLFWPVLVIVLDKKDKTAFTKLRIVWNVAFNYEARSAFF